MDGWWDRVVATRVIRCGCRRPGMMAARQHVLPLARGDVFEVGCGDGINLPLLDKSRVRSFCGIDPSAELLESARAVAAVQELATELRQACGEEIPWPDASFDTVLTTFTLCSVNDPAAVMRELRRVLRPGGAILFLEHGLAPDPSVQKWQRRIDPVSKLLLGNCHMSREVSGSFRRAGFETECRGSHYIPELPRYAGWIEWGEARA